MAGRETNFVFGRKGIGVGDGSFEEDLGFGEFLQMNESFGAVVEQGGVLREGGDEGGVEERPGRTGCCGCRDGRAGG